MYLHTECSALGQAWIATSVILGLNQGDRVVHSVPALETRFGCLLLQEVDS